MKKRNKKQLVAVNNQPTITASNALELALSLNQGFNPSISGMNAWYNTTYELLSLQPMIMTYLPKTYGILDKIIRIPVDDAYKGGGFDLESDTLEEDEIKELLDALVDNNDVQRVKEANYWARQFGGAAVVAITPNGLDQPLNKDNLEGGKLEFAPIERWRLNYSKSNVNIPGGFWTVTQYNASTDYNVRIHPSRVFIKHGKVDSFLIQQQVQGWGVSVFESIIQDISLFFKGRNSFFELIDEAKVDIIKLATLQQALMTGSSDMAIRKLLDLIANNLNYKSKLLMSTDDDYIQKQVSFSGVAEVLKEIRVMIAGSSSIPVNKLWGEGVTGFGSGEDSLENYNSQIENEVRTPDIPLWKWILDLRCRQLFGREVPDLTIIWKNLRVLSAIDEQNINDKKLANALQLFDRQLLTPQEVMEYLKKQQIFIQETKALKGELEDMPLQRQEFNEDKQVDVVKE